MPKKLSSRRGARGNKSSLLTANFLFKLLALLAICGFLIQILLLWYHPNTDVQIVNDQVNNNQGSIHTQTQTIHKNPPSPALRQQQQPQQHADINTQPHVYPPLPHLPPFAPIPNSDSLIADVLSGSKPTISGIAALLTRFISDLHVSNRKLSSLPSLIKNDNTKYPQKIRNQFFELAATHLLPFDAAYRNRPIFPIRVEEDSIYISLAAFREHLLGETLRQVYGQAKHPEKIYVGAVVQNCFGVEYTCRTGAQVIGKNAQGRDMTKVSDAPPDRNGIEEFCSDPLYGKYCDNHQIRALYVNETESLGPAMARYFASKLWGGETFFMQADSHLKFAQDWDVRYVEEAKAAASYPKVVLSSYPPGFTELGHDQIGEDSLGTRLCSCEFSRNDIEYHIIRVNTGGRCHKDDTSPTQIAFIAAGFFFTRAEFLTDVPFDPLLPWCFMGEEILLSMRAWTNGWDIYAPRKNLLAHQYRPGRMGLPKFWGSVGRLFGKPMMNTLIQKTMILRIKYLVGYNDMTSDLITKGGDGEVLIDIEHYGMGEVRSREDYLKFTNIDVEKEQCHPIPWCTKGTMP